MLAPHLKRKVDKLWNNFWAAGITNPLVAVEQITYLLFLKRLEGLDAERVAKNRKSIYSKDLNKNGDQCRWRYIKQEKSDIKHLIDVVFPWLRELESIIERADDNGNGSTLKNVGRRMSDAYFQLDPGKGAILSEAIDLIDELFGHIDISSVSDDIIGDIFEYLLSEISTSGKNGQFRTPRHIIRTMVEMVGLQPGMRIIDPAAGTGGFLFSAMDYLLALYTDKDSLKIEWDGTPHRADGAGLAENYDEVFQGLYFVGIDNDRTMVRIGWMNMILHGLTNPQIHQRDSLAKRIEDSPLNDLIASETYDRVLANPPFTGNVDKADLESSLFPKAGTRGKKASQVITNKSELLFVWLMLDLLKVGGRCAVIVPEGVLFGGTEAHAALRRELLTEHRVEGVISLPAGAFQPYTGVKTSILIFQKETNKNQARQWNTNDSPRTANVWFYEVIDEAYTPDAKRNERQGQNNDLWDVIEKFKVRNDAEADEMTYYQPQYYMERWRFVGQDTLTAFADIKEVSHWKDKVASIRELFDLPAEPAQAQALIEKKQINAIKKWMDNALMYFIVEFSKKTASQQEKDKKKQAEKIVYDAAKKVHTVFHGKNVKDLFDKEDRYGLPLFQKAVQSAFEEAREDHVQQLARTGNATASEITEEGLTKEIQDIAREYAKLDGYDVMLRTLKIFKQNERLKESKSWTAPVRVYTEDPDWQSPGGKLKGSHDKNGNVRPEYVADIELYDDKGKLNEFLLDSDCIEARNWNLSAGQYKPFSFAAIQSEKSVVETIRELKQKEEQIIKGLDSLLTMVEGK
jgi:type I restriction enzyme M protein